MSNTPMKCAFCEATQDEARAFVSGPAIFICDQCLGVAANAMAVAGEVASTAQARLQLESRNLTKYCSFCGKGVQEAKRLLCRPAACICDECIRTSLEIIVGGGTAHPKIVPF